MHKGARLLAWLEKLTKEGGLRLSKVSQFLVPAAPYSSLFISFLVHQSRFVERCYGWGGSWRFERWFRAVQVFLDE